MRWILTLFSVCPIDGVKLPELFKNFKSSVVLTLINVIFFFSQKVETTGFYCLEQVLNYILQLCIRNRLVEFVLEKLSLMKYF